jgi:hypothetical protein
MDWTLWSFQPFDYRPVWSISVYSARLPAILPPATLDEDHRALFALRYGYGQV